MVGSVPLSATTTSIVLTELVVLALTVVSVADGDTIVVADGDRKITLRLAEIDAPGSRQAPASVHRSPPCKGIRFKAILSLPPNFR